MNSIMGTAQGKLIEAQKIREEREKELMIQREKMSENVRKLVRERTDLMNINHNKYNKDIISISLNNINNNNIRNHNYHNFNHNPNSVDTLINTPIHNSSTINISNDESINSINHLYKKNLNDNKKFLHSMSYNSNEKSNSSVNDILNIWTFPTKKNDDNDNSSFNTDNNIINGGSLINSYNEINKNSSEATLFDDNKLSNTQKKKKTFYPINNKNVKLQSLKKEMSGNNNNTKIKNIMVNDDDILKKENNSESSLPYKKRLYIKPYICEKQYRRGLDRYNNSNSSSLNKMRNRNRNSEIDTSLFNGNPCIPESLKLRLEHERSKNSADKIFFNNPNDIFKKNSALIDAIEAEKKLNLNIEKNMNKSNDLLFNVEDDDNTIVEHDIIPDVKQHINQNEKYRRTFDKEKFKKANNKYF
ncbi:hypothetical protein BCR36DRAFT_402713 [Piromyces finnis]|uniref:Uncharacterized protein n=1 Tax=Piromyces finnis TaxID=1754191 RepID=A0A1Y1VGQ8_9FUNG|nr:hypothetical protein BCR36DRAFT_402713 [Piromyces finnis]|eukprot:ORX55908.1 hypothetical protein BCR36DRAFT_402713 [Piromyces finnis]